MLLTGLLLGFSIAAPVGPAGVLRIRQTQAHGQAAGFISGLGAATARHGYASRYASTLFLTLTNPMTILSFTAIFAGLDLAALASLLGARLPWHTLSLWERVGVRAKGTARSLAPCGRCVEETPTRPYAAGLAGGA